MKTPPYEFQTTTVPFIGGVYRAFCLRVIDGDTVDLLVDVGLDVYKTERVRVHGINAPELHATDPKVRAQAIAARDFTARAIEDKVVRVQTYKTGDEKYGRFLADIQVLDGSGRDVGSLGAMLIANGLAVPFMP